MAIAAFIVLLNPLAYAAKPPPSGNVRITDVNDLDLGSWDLVSDVTGNDPACVYRDDGSTKYKITATDTSTITPNKFRLENVTGTVEIPYQLDWSNNASPGTIGLIDGNSKNADGANTASETCSVGGLSSNFQVLINANDLAGTPSGIYSTTITLTIEPR